MWCRRQREETDSVVDGSLSAEVSLITLDMLEIIIQVYCCSLLCVHLFFFKLFYLCVAVCVAVVLVGTDSSSSVRCSDVFTVCISYFAVVVNTSAAHTVYIVMLQHC